METDNCMRLNSFIAAWCMNLIVVQCQHIAEIAVVYASCPRAVVYASCPRAYLRGSYSDFSLLYGF